MTKQEYFNLLVETSAAGKFPASTDAGTTCMYRTPDGRKCAFGILIPDELYQPSMEGKNTTGLLLAFPDLHHVTPADMTASDLWRVQQEHDNMAKVGWDHVEFVANLLRLPCFYDVKVPVLT